MSMIDKVFLIYVALVAIISIIKVWITNPNNGFSNNLMGFLIGFPLGIGISFLFSAVVLWLIIGILSFLGISSVGAWTVGFSWTAVKGVMIALFLIRLIGKG